jgi:lysozyme
MNFEALIAALKEDEGLRLEPYLDTASPPRMTIGYGRNLSDVGISDQEAHDMLVRDAIKAQMDAADLIPNWLALDDVRKNALSNMAYNLGKGGLAQFHHLLDAVDRLAFVEAAGHGRNSKWFTQVGSRAKRLMDELETGTAA